jgi:uncharacterized protein with HEPN domain
LTPDAAHVAHILECIRLIDEFTVDGRDSFDNDIKTRLALTRLLHELSESAMRLSPAIQEANPHVPWKDIRDFRHVVVHGYLGLDENRIWKVISESLPPLKQHIQRIQQQLPS